MLKIIGQGEIHQIVKLFSDETLKNFSDFVQDHPVLKRAKFEQKPFTFSYFFIEDKGLIVVTGYKLQKDVELNLGTKPTEKTAIRHLVNNYLDSNKTI